MSYGGDGVVKRSSAVVNAAPTVRRMKAGRLQISDSDHVEGLNRACALCGDPITEGQASNEEHGLPQWLHRYAGNVGDVSAKVFHLNGSVPTWKEITLTSHVACNSEFDRRVERPVQGTVKEIVEGSDGITRTQIDDLFNWLDKVKCTLGTTGVALSGNALSPQYHDFHFPNLRIGRFDRLAMFFRIEDPDTTLDVWPFLTEAFLTTPSVMAIQIKGLVCVYVSANCLLSYAFALPRLIKGRLVLSAPYNRSPTLGTRRTRIPGAKILAQPMRRQYLVDWCYLPQDIVQKNGDGWIMELSAAGWQRRNSVDFSELSTLPRNIAMPLVNLEIIEWLLLCKEEDAFTYGQNEGFFLNSMDELREAKKMMLAELSRLRGSPLDDEDRLPDYGQKKSEYEEIYQAMYRDHQG